QAYNNWIAEEFVKVDPDRLIGLPCMPALDVEESIRDMERCLRLGMRGVWLNTMPSVGPTIRPEDDRFWDAAQALGAPVHFHVRVMRQLQKPKPKGVRGDDLTGLATVGARDMIVDMAEIIQSGVHDRFPTLVWVAVETGCGWIPYLLEQLDDRWWRNRSWLPIKLKHEPSFYFRRNWRAAFMIDRYAVMNRHVIGVENMLWSTDYPHHGSRTDRGARSGADRGPPGDQGRDRRDRETTGPPACRRAPRGIAARRLLLRHPGHSGGRRREPDRTTAPALAVGRVGGEEPGRGRAG